MGILVIGGSTDTISTYRDTVHVIYPTTGSVELYEERLPYGADGLSPIIVDGILYWFGGRIVSGGGTIITDHWATHVLPEQDTSTASPSDQLYVDIGRRNKKRYVC